MLSWFFGAETLAILTIISSALGVAHTSCTFIDRSEVSSAICW